MPRVLHSSKTFGTACNEDDDDVQCIKEVRVLTKKGLHLDTDTALLQIYNCTLHCNVVSLHCKYTLLHRHCTILQINVLNSTCLQGFDT